MESVNLILMDDGRLAEMRRNQTVGRVLLGRTPFDPAYETRHYCVD